jgi:hypothetical protein
MPGWRLKGLLTLHDNDVEEISDTEEKVRKWLEFLYRFAMAVFISCHLFDFLFSPIWMHGYLW